MRDSLRNHEKRSHLNRTEVINNLVLRGADIENSLPPGHTANAVLQQVSKLGLNIR